METINSKVVKIRKPRKCWGCATEFQAGASLNYCTNVDGGEISNVHFCFICTQWFAEYDDGEGVEFGALADDEDWKKIRQEMEEKKP